MRFIQNDDPVQTLPTNGSDQAFAIRILPGRPRCNGHFLDPHVPDAFPENVSVDAIAVSVRFQFVIDDIQSSGKTVRVACYRLVSD